MGGDSSNMLNYNMTNLTNISKKLDGYMLNK